MLALPVDYLVVVLLLGVGAYLRLAGGAQHLPRRIQVDQADVIAGTTRVVAHCLRGGDRGVDQRPQGSLRHIHAGIVRRDNVLDLRLEHVVFALKLLEHLLNAVQFADQLRLLHFELLQLVQGSARRLAAPALVLLFKVVAELLVRLLQRLDLVSDLSVVAGGKQ